MSKTTEPMRPYLIQRGKFKDAALDQITGPDSILRWDYMGSSEFEWGALPQSLRRMDARHADYAVHETPHVSHDGQRVYLLCAGDPTRALAALAVVADGEARFKETPYLKERLSGKDWAGRPAGDYITDVGFWWDIGNDWMAVLGQMNAERVRIAMDRLHEKWSKAK